MKHLQDLEAKLLRLMMLRAQINMRGDVLDFLRKTVARDRAMFI